MKNSEYWFALKQTTQQEFQRVELEYRDLQLCLDRHYKCQRSLRGRHRTKINYRIANLEPKLAKAWSAYLKVIRRLDYQSEQYRITRERETDFFWRLTRP